MSKNGYSGLDTVPFHWCSILNVMYGLYQKLFEGLSLHDKRFEGWWKRLGKNKIHQSTQFFLQCITCGGYRHPSMTKKIKIMVWKVYPSTIVMFEYRQQSYKIRSNEYYYDNQMHRWQILQGIRILGRSQLHVKEWNNQGGTDTPVLQSILRTALETVRR